MSRQRRQCGTLFRESVYAGHGMVSMVPVSLSSFIHNFFNLSLSFLDARPHAAEALKLVPASNAQPDPQRAQSKRELKLAVQKRVPVGPTGAIGALVRKRAVVDKEPEPELARLQTGALVKRRISILRRVMPKDVAQLRPGNLQEPTRIYTFLVA